MTVKNKILQNIRKSLVNISETSHPGKFQSAAAQSPAEKLEQFKDSLAAVGGKWQWKDDFLKNYRSDGLLCYSDIYADLSNFKPDELSPKSFEPLEDLITAAEFGVAENAALWVNEPRTFHRSAFFLCKNLYLVLKQDNIFQNMHEAYQAIEVTYDYGVFISGPSKTADIEQCLVIGAHGPLSLTVLLE